MKQLDIEKQLVDKVQDQVVIPKQQEYRLAGTLTLKPHQKMYAINLKTKEIEEVVLEGELVFGSDEIKGKTYQHPDCIYYAAYNVKQVEKHIVKKLLKIKKQIDKGEI